MKILHLNITNNVIITMNNKYWDIHVKSQIFRIIFIKSYETLIFIANYFIYNINILITVYIILH